jgi:phosphopantothenoylcysteine decarboxylase/phosphopantothenate--cysteine ligase
MDTKKIALGVSSSISLYKACEVLRGFQKSGLVVQVIMTPNAAKLVSPVLFSSLAGTKTIVDLFDDHVPWSVAHVSLAKEVSLFCIAPATANVIAKLAAGVADDFLTTFYLAVDCPVLIAPAMNQAMYLHAQTQSNISRLRAAGVEFVEPETGYLACGDEGPGRLAEPEDVVRMGMTLIGRTESLKGKTVLVTAGPTREHLDPVRFLSNPSSGKMGYELAREALRRGARVILISGPTYLVPPAGAALCRVRTAAEMEREVLRRFSEADIVVMAAAVSDYRFARTAPRKIKKRKAEESVDLVRTPDILRGLGAKKGNRVLVGFAAETEDPVRNAKKKLKEKSLDLIVANNVLEKGIGFESEDNRVQIVRASGRVRSLPRMSKRETSRLIFDEIEALRDIPRR